MEPEAKTREQAVGEGRLWVGFATGVAAWFALGIADMLITWKACTHQEQYGGAMAHPVARALYIVVTLLLIASAIATGVLSYRNWRRLAAENRLLDAEGRGRQEFMALLGVYVSFTLGFGMLWLGLPVFLLQMCLRTR